MKKVLLLGALMASTVTIASAQMWVGGSLSWTNQSNDVTQEIDDLIEYNYSREENSNTISFAPEIGYDLNDRWSVALSLGYAHSSITYEYFYNNVPSDCFPTLNSKQTSAVNTWSFNPYVRYRAASYGKLNLFVDAGVGYALSHLCGSDETAYAVRFHVNPGLSYRLTDRFVLVSHIGGIEYQNQWYDKADYSNSTFKIGLSNSLSVGFYVYL